MEGDGEPSEVRQPLAPLFGVLVLLLAMAGLMWLLCATIFRAPWLGWVLVGLTSPFALNVVSQFRTGGLTIRADGVRAPARIAWCPGRRSPGSPPTRLRSWW